MRVRRLSVRHTMRVLARYGRLCERRYGCSADEMARAVMAGERTETAAIARWLVRDQALRHLRALGGDDS